MSHPCCWSAPFYRHVTESRVSALRACSSQKDTLEWKAGQLGTVMLSMRIPLSAWLRTSPPTGAILWWNWVEIQMLSSHNCNKMGYSCCRGNSRHSRGLSMPWSALQLLKTCFLRNPIHICWNANMKVVLRCFWVKVVMWELLWHLFIEMHELRTY